VTTNTNTGPPYTGAGNWNELNLNLFTSNNWRASLVPAAAVIPAPIVYTKAVAVKALVVISPFKSGTVILLLIIYIYLYIQIFNNNPEETLSK